MAVRKSTDWIVIHCSATRPSMNIGAKEITAWHKAKGWVTIGYHHVVRRNGKLEAGRAEATVGAHVEGHNHNSVAVCWVGGVNEDTLGPEDNRTPEQKAALKVIVARLRAKYPKAKVIGHHDFPGVHKACPCFDAKAEFS